MILIGGSDGGEDYSSNGSRSPSSSIALSAVRLGVSDVPLGLDTSPEVVQGTPKAEASVHGEEVLELPSLYGDSNRDLEGRQTSEWSQLYLEAIICSYPWSCAYWTAIARCESGLGQNPYAYNDSNPNIGLFQIWEGHEYDRQWLYDDRNNVQAAWELSSGGANVRPWPNCP